MANVVYIALGSNLEDRLENLRASIEEMHPMVLINDCSSIYETPPWGYISQPAFLNQVCKGETDLQPQELLLYLKKIEQNVGRKTTFLYGPRIIDLDILFYNDLIYKSSNLTIPHPRIEDRAFVVVPLADISPDLNHPVLGKTVQELLSNLDTGGIEKYDSKDF